MVTHLKKERKEKENKGESLLSYTLKTELIFDVNKYHSYKLNSVNVR